MFRISEQIGLCAAYKHIICKSVNLGWKIKLFLCGGMCRNSAHQPFPRPVTTVLSCSVADYQSVVFWMAWPSALSPSGGHGVVLFCDWLSVSCLLSGVPISPFPVRWPRCCLVLCLIISQLSFECRAHQPFPRPMATVLSCFVIDYQSVAFWVACPSALSLSGGHGVRPVTAA